MAFKKGTPKPANSGRPKGAPNKVTTDLRKMILGALDKAGGEDYLVTQAEESPASFLALVGKCLPKDVNVTANVTLSELLRRAREKHGG